MTTSDWTPRPKRYWSAQEPHWSNDIDPQFSCPVCDSTMMITGTSGFVARIGTNPSAELPMDQWICTDIEDCDGCFHGERISGAMFDDGGKPVTPKVLGEPLVLRQWKSEK